MSVHRIAPDIDVAAIDRDGNLSAEFAIDSMDFLSLLIALNKRFDIPIPDTDYPSLGSFSSAVAYCANKIALPTCGLLLAH